jgi:hypothetical protein
VLVYRSQAVTGYFLRRAKPKARGSVKKTGVASRRINNLQARVFFIPLGGAKRQVRTQNDKLG